MKGWDPSVHTKVQNLDAWPGQDQQIAKDYLELRGGNGQVSYPEGDSSWRWHPVPKPASKSQSCANKNKHGTPLSLAFQGMLTGHTMFGENIV